MSSRDFFKLLVERHRIAPRELERLIGETISFDNGGGADVIAQVDKVEERRVYYRVLVHPFQNETNHLESEGQLEVFYCSGKRAYHFDNQGRMLSIDAYRVHTSPPLGMAFSLNSNEFQILPNDAHLPRLLDAIRENVEQISGASDLVRLVKHVRTMVPFTERRDDSLDLRLSLGHVVAKEGAVCRHLVGLVHTYLLLEGINSDILGSKEPIENEAHSFLRVYLSGKEYLVDPALCRVCAYAELEEQFALDHKTTKYHLPNKSFAVAFIYGV